jgi:hypothetical protein
MAAKAQGSNAPRDKEWYELRLYHLEDGSKRKKFEDFCRQAAIPALNRIGIEPVGVFQFAEGDSPDVYVLLPHDSPGSFITLVQRLADDDAFLEAGAEFLAAPFDDPAYQRYESSLLLAFDGHPQLTVPSQKDSRVFQLRTYESHNTERAQKKIEMFNIGGEIDVFHRVGLKPVFFGEALIGTKLPNLTYMLGFDDQAALDAAWKKFRSDPGWLELKDNPEYKETVSHITNILLRPAGCSQI